MDMHRMIVPSPLRGRVNYTPVPLSPTCPSPEGAWERAGERGLIKVWKDLNR